MIYVWLMNNQRIKSRAVFYFKNLYYDSRIEGICRKSINGFGRNGYTMPRSEPLGGFLDIIAYYCFFKT